MKNISSKNSIRIRIKQSLKWPVGIVRGFIGIVSGQRGAVEHLLSTWSFFVKADYVFGKPVNVTIEPTNICNIRCPVCETGSGLLRREKKMMTLDEFKIIADKIAPFTNTLMFYFMGEPFLNGDSYEMIKHARKKGISFITTCTNGSIIDPVKLVESGIDEVSFQISGLTKDIHEIYRSGSDFDSVIDNLKKTIKARNERRSKMRIACGFILMKQNEHQARDFKKYMRQIGVDKAMIIDPCVRTVEQGRRFLPSNENHWIYDPISFKRGELRPIISSKNGCSWIYYSVVIHVNGDVVPCCRDVNGDFVMGNVLKQEFNEIWNGSDFISFRKRMRFKKNKVDICNLCSGYGIAQLKNNVNGPLY
jgi:radical SAM protein with 4Fe4S-binding SPASM domain